MSNEVERRYQVIDSIINGTKITPADANDWFFDQSVRTHYFQGEAQFVPQQLHTVAHHQGSQQAPNEGAPTEPAAPSPDSVGRISGWLRGPGGEFTPSTHKQVKHLEKVIGVKLPASYSRLLHEYGCTEINANAVVESDGRAWPFLSFFGTVAEAMNPAQDYTDHLDLQDARLLPFGDDIFDNRYALSLDDGSIWYIDYEGECLRHPVATDFDAFLDAIRATLEP